MLRKTFLFLSEQRTIQRAVMNNGISRKMALRFVAGETLSDALSVVARLNGQGLLATLDHLGENVAAPEEAARAADTYLEILRSIHESKVNCNASLKLTQMGLDIGIDLCRKHVRRILEKAGEHGNFVRIDMEGSSYTERTLQLFKEFRGEFENVGIVIQAYLYRSAEDIEDLIRQRARVRLCKGAYYEPPHLAFPRKEDVDRNFERLMIRLLTAGNYPALATHDEKLIQKATDFAQKEGINKKGFEFQMLHGIRRDLQDSLMRSGYNVRVYVPFGYQWYPYFMRRLAERPANLFFVLGNVVKER